jgi:RNA-directed DNA polymerase
MAFTSLNHYLDVEWMEYAYACTRKDGAVGVDGQTAEEYAVNLQDNLADLIDRLKSGRYRAPPLRRHYIDKPGGGKRGLSIPSFEDKLAQRAIVMLLEPIFEQDFLDCSFGYRPGRNAHQALQVLHSGIMRWRGYWVLEVDIRKFFDSLPRTTLRESLARRVTDGVVRRLIDKWLKAGVLESGQIHYPETGTPQGSVASPILSNVVLHQVIDEWFTQQVQPRLRGPSTLVRFCDDFVMLFAHKRFALPPLGLSIAAPLRERSCTATNRMRELRSCGSVRAEGSDVLGYSKTQRQFAREFDGTRRIATHGEFRPARGPTVEWWVQ